MNIDDDIIPATVRDEMIVEHSLAKFGTDTKFRDTATENFIAAQTALITQDPRMLKLKEDLALVAECELHPELKKRLVIMIYGESGTGKELCARIVHGKRRGKLVTVNCSAIPTELFEVEMFGSKRGSYTDSKTDTVGKFVAADGGTIFLDEVGDLPASHQTKLLRVIQSREVTRVGDTEPIRFDALIVCATNKNLAQMTNTHHFRRDLYERLNVLAFSTVPLRDRIGDVRMIIDAFCMRYDLTPIADLPSPEIYEHGNVRALESWIIRQELSII